MNWVGGSRKRIIFTKDRRKQKDFFEKEKLKSKMRVLRQSPLKQSVVSLDLLNLHVVNQISTKKNHSDRVQKPVHVDIDQIPGRWRNIELPKTPEHEPPKPFLDDAQKRLQKEVLENRRKYLSEKENLRFQATSQSHVVGNIRSESDRPRGVAPDGRMATGKDLEHGSRRELWFGITHDRETLNAIQDTRPVATVFEEKNHQFLTTPSSECYHSFSNKNIINQPFIHAVDDHQTSSMYGFYDVKEMPPISSCAERCPAERELESIFTAPEQIYSQNAQSFSTLDQEPIKNQRRDYSIQDRNPVILSEQQEEATDSESADEAPQLSSQCPSYSPEQTEKCASTTSDESAEEDQDGNMSSYYKNYIPRNDGNGLAVLGSRRSRCHCHSMDMPFIHHDYGTRDGANVCPQLKPTVDLKKYDRALPPQIISHASFKTKHARSKASHHAWSQTEKCAWETGKSDAAVQCDLIQACGCKNELSSVHSAEIVTSTSKVETTGGQNIPADRAAFQPSSTSSAILVKGVPSETESLRQHSKMSIGTSAK
ncbi:uncharacterized protein C12orf40 homolog [Eublepharis macularius]|uniref:Uncharacterized protein C12orf40 homolog n=1 Tax=Eublepharis macularius TaxID=481883 RepID=A0AA97L668_EUBMA|nr:uncharacterized protein C12orf40 homolog [Eublepharis macularius]